MINKIIKHTENETIIKHIENYFLNIQSAIRVSFRHCRGLEDNYNTLIPSAMIDYNYNLLYLFYIQTILFGDFGLITIYLATSL